MSERETNNEIFVLNSINRSITQDDGQVNLKEVKKELKSKSEKEVSMNCTKKDARRDFILVGFGIPTAHPSDEHLLNSRWP